jgi:hypothetical protein
MISTAQEKKSIPERERSLLDKELEGVINGDSVTPRSTGPRTREVATCLKPKKTR